MEAYLETDAVRIVAATIAVLAMGAGIGYITRKTGLDRRLAAPICILIIVPTWLVLGLFHLVLWQRAAIILLLYPSAALCIGTSIGTRIARVVQRKQRGRSLQHSHR